MPARAKIDFVLRNKRCVFRTQRRGWGRGVGERERERGLERDGDVFGTDMKRFHNNRFCKLFIYYCLHMNKWSYIFKLCIYRRCCCCRRPSSSSSSSSSSLIQQGTFLFFVLRKRMQVGLLWSSQIRSILCLHFDLLAEK